MPESFQVRLEPLSPLTVLREALASGRITPLEVARDASDKTNSSASHNTYLHFDREGLLAQAEALMPRPAEAPLWSVPISLKDCFDLAGTRTTLGSRFYAERNPVASADSAIAHSLRAAGCLITGKTHLHPIAYGITGQSPDYGDSLQPRDAALLTGGSSSGAVASVQEGSALAAIGTDTGGSVRVPAALGGLVGYRASHSLASASGWFPGAWAGGWHLAASFDTLGLLFRDPRDAAPLAQAVLHIPSGAAPKAPRIGCVPISFLHDSTAEVLEAYAAWKQQFARAGAKFEEFDTAPWSAAVDILAPIQAHEAAQLHRGHYDEFDASISQRLRWGASIPEDEVAALRERHRAFRESVDALLRDFDFLMLPAAPVARLLAAADHSQTRAMILRYTAPFSLAGVPVVSLPGELLGAPLGTGVQLAAAQVNDPALLAYVGDVLSA